MMTDLDKYPVDSLSRDFGVALGRSYPKSAQPSQQGALKPSPRITFVVSRIIPAAFSQIKAHC